MHATKRDLRIWIAAMFMVLTSSKGISSVVMARVLGVNQKTAWKMGHAIRELMDDRDVRLPKIDDIVEADEALIGGASRSWPLQTRSGTKSMVLVAASRQGQARAAVISNKQASTIDPHILAWIDTGSVLITDGSSSYDAVGAKMAADWKVRHSHKQYSIPGLGVHTNTAEALISQAQRAVIGVYHNLGPQHLQRYLDKIVWRWNQRAIDDVRTVHKVSKKTGKQKTKKTIIWKPIPVIQQMRKLLRDAVGRQLRRSKDYGLSWPA